MYPWQDQNATPRFALLLTSLADDINIDRAALRQAGLTRLHSVNSGEKALEIIRSQAGENPALAVDFIICAGALSDMSASVFMRAFAASGSSLPLMFISGNESELAAALSHGASASLRRPYSMNELTRAVESIRSPKRTQTAPPAQNIQAKSSRPAPAQDAKASAAPPAAPKNEENTGNKLLWTRSGLSQLKHGKLEAAHKLLAGALDYDPLDLEAAMGLSRLFKERGDLEKCQRWLHRAGCICLATRQTERAEMIFSRLPEKWQGDHELIEAQELLQEENFDAACEAFMHICSTRPNMPLHRLIGRACQFTAAPEDTMRELCAALMRAGYESTARSLAARMLINEDDRQWEPGGFLSAFPRLQEVWAVARYTAHALRAAG